jgi:hypothetical protein
LRSDCAAIAQRLQSDHKVIAGRLCSDCKAICTSNAQRWQNDHKLIAERLRSDYLCSDCKVIADLSPRDFLGFKAAHRWQIDCKAIALQSDGRARKQSDRKAIAKLIASIAHRSQGDGTAIEK